MALRNSRKENVKNAHKIISSETFFLKLFTFNSEVELA